MTSHTALLAALVKMNSFSCLFSTLFIICNLCRVFGFTGTLLLPIDIALSAGGDPPSPVLEGFWATVYWVTFMMTWLLLPLMQARTPATALHPVRPVTARVPAGVLRCRPVQLQGAFRGIHQTEFDLLRYLGRAGTRLPHLDHHREEPHDGQTHVLPLHSRNLHWAFVHCKDIRCVHRPCMYSL